MRSEEASTEGGGHRVGGGGGVAGWELGGDIFSGQSSSGRLPGGGGCTEPGRMGKAYRGSLLFGVGGGAVTQHKYRLGLPGPAVGTAEPGAATCAASWQQVAEAV